MSTLRTSIVSSAEQVFDRGGFAASSVDDLARAAGVSTRTLYKHLGSKSGLVAAVLKERSDRFFAFFDVDDVADLFRLLAAWTEREGARGCLFLRAEGEGGDPSTRSAVAAAVTVYRERLYDLVQRIVAADIGREAPAVLVEQILVLFEGATSAASYRGVPAILAARSAADVLLDRARTSPAHP